MAGQSDAQDFLKMYEQKVAGSFSGPELVGSSFSGPEIAAVVGVPAADGSGRFEVQMDVPGLGDTERAGAVGIFGTQQLTGPAFEAAEKYGMAPYLGQQAPPRSMTGKTIPAPAHPTFNREATEMYMPGVMKGIGPGQMPVYRY